MFTGAKPEDFESEQEIELREEAAAKEAEAALWVPSHDIWALHLTCWSPVGLGT